MSLAPDGDAAPPAGAPEPGATTTASAPVAEPGTAVTTPYPRTVGWAERMPTWLGSIRFRLTAIYSLVLFGLAAMVIGGIYFALQHSLKEETVYETAIVVQPIPGGVRFTQEDVAPIARVVEHAANERAVELLRDYSFGALLVLFVASLGVGWVVAGRVLMPIERITGVARDIQATDLKRRIHLKGPDDELKELADTFDDMLGRIDDAFEEQKLFIHEASHELRNPLAVIRTNLDVTLADPDVDVDDMRQTMQVVSRSTERMSRLVDDLVVYARKGTTSPEMSRVDVGQLVHEVGEEFVAPAEARGLHLHEAAPPGLHVQGDRIMLKRALANLLANAVRIAPAGSDVRLSAGAEGPWVWMAVEDDGPGIADEDQERVFQRFWRGDTRTSRQEGRSGLGLTIVRQIAEAHGGEVRLVSELGRGSAFAIWLPAI